MITHKQVPKSPTELGLPDKFQDWRANQAEGVDLASNNPGRITVICAPTGFGKELLCVSTARLAGVPTCIVTDTRGLQDQYLHAYKHIGIADVRGQRNYTCSYRADYTCEEGFSSRCPYKGSVMCPSSQAEIRASTSPLVLTNYAKWTSSKRYTSKRIINVFSHIQQVIFDECHAMPDALEEALQVMLNYREINNLGMDFPQGADADDMKEWRLWAIAARATAENEAIKTLDRMSKSNDVKASWVRHFNHMKKLVKRLGMISTASAKDWVVDHIPDIGYQFDPIRPGRYVEATLFQKVPKILCVSATVRPKTMQMIGLSPSQYTFQEYPSDFDPARCPIYWVPTMTVRGLGQDLSPVWLKLDQWIAKRQGRNGIVHTISFDRQRQCVRGSRYGDNMLMNMRGDPPTELVEFFKSRPDTGTILVSPSLHTGYDFPHSQCRWQFVAKVPFEPPSKIMKARTEIDKEYPYYRAMQYLVQAFGRDMRDKTDWSERIIVDDQIEWFIPKYGHLAPKSFLEVFRKSNVLPRPLQL